MSDQVREIDPRILIVGRPSFDIDAFLEYLAREQLEWRRSEGAGPAEELVEVAGRMCYLSFGARQSSKDNRDYIGNLIRRGHESVLEHVSWTFLLTNVTRAFSHQLVRHRVGFAFSQLSQQYADQTDLPSLMPPTVSASPELRDAWVRSSEQAHETYEFIFARLEGEMPSSPNVDEQRERLRGIRSAARSVLPESMETRIVLTANARALRHFLDVRGGLVGDLEMRMVSASLLRLLKLEAPALFADFETTDHEGAPLVRHVQA
jgi:thymidylate synthase (FAD)